MRNTYFQMLHSMKRTFTDLKPLLSKFITIAVVILILGSAFSGVFTKESFSPVVMGYINEDEGDAGEVLLDNLKKSDSASQWLKLKEVNSYDEAQRLAGDSDVDENDKINGMLYIPKDFSEKFEDGQDCSVTVYMGKTSQLQTTITKCVFGAFASEVNLNQVVYTTFNTGVSEEHSEDSGTEQIPMKSEKTPGAMDYYAMAMLMMFLIFSAEYGCNCIADNYLGTIGERLKTTPIRPAEQYIGNLAGLCLSSTLQGIFLVIFTKVLYGVNWGDNIVVLLLIIFSLSCTAIALGALFCMITQKRAQGQTLVTVLVIVSTFLAGGFVRMDMGQLKYISPNYYAQTALTTAIYSGTTPQVWRYIGILWIFTAAAGLATVLLSRRKRA